MLVLSRMRDESIIIGNNIVVTIVGTRGDKVRLGIDCPKEIPVHRKEIYDAIQIENLKAMRSDLAVGDYEKAYDIFYNNRGEFGKGNFPTREEVDKMVYGLRGLGAK